ncbi:GNAT family N-acetyltransferase [Candidatus Amarolinea dominans]|uniref:GNAT family N-acetyltransferase n=1 Tax=Candidatus Amarolinea dominans TaxID=3140696 RepID=UPI003134E8FD|nr:GNAT family N-acetyltransferase [Anaerolineae bacterium]
MALRLPAWATARVRPWSMTTNFDTLAERPLTAADYDQLLALWELAGLHIRPTGRDSRAAFAQQAAGQVQRAIGLWQGPALVGVVLATHDSRRGYINRLAVAPTYRRHGLGRRLIAACEAWFASLGIEVWSALIENWNDASFAIFVAAGYTRHADITYVSKRERPEA